MDALNVLAPPDADVRVLISVERRGTNAHDDGIQKFLGKLQLTFDVTTAWSSFESEDELPALLSGSHVNDNAKPLLLYSASRRRST